MQTMSPLDASFLHIENDVTHMHVGWVGIFEGPAPEPEEVPAEIAAPPHDQLTRWSSLSPRSLSERSRLDWGRLSNCAKVANNASTNAGPPNASRRAF